MKVIFYGEPVDEKMGFAVIAARHNGKWVLGRHQDRTTYETPGGHREAGETIEETARRELYEESGAERYDLFPVCMFSFGEKGDESFGMLYCAEIFSFGPLPPFEIAEVRLFDSLPQALTYPEVFPRLVERCRGCWQDFPPQDS